ncbi:MAG: hypothetical protein DSY77_15590, partial [Bacteroidetes bacterium]
NEYSKLRLLNDFLFITFILFGKNPIISYNFLLLILPLINSINFSGNKKTILLYAVFVFSLVILYVTYHILQPGSITQIDIVNTVVTVLVLGVVEWYTSLRLKVRNFREVLIEAIDEYYVNPSMIEKPHLVFREVVNEINDKINDDLVTHLYCFLCDKEVNNKLIIVNGSRFIYEYEFEENYAENVKSKDFKIDANIKLDKNISTTNLSMYVKLEDREYIFVFLTKRTIPVYLQIIGIQRVVKSAIYKMAKFLTGERILREFKDEEKRKLSNNRKYVDRSIGAMHYIRNRLGPIKNVSKVLEVRHKVPAEKSEEFNEKLEKELNQTKNELNNIIQRADYLLEKSNNPFENVATDLIHFSKIFSTFKRTIYKYLGSTATIDLIYHDQIDDIYVEISLEGYEIFLIDWISNIEKHGDGNFKSEFIVEKNTFSLKIENGFPEKDLASVQRLIAELSNHERIEISSRNTYGINQVYKFLTRNNLKSKISIKNSSTLCLVIEFEIVKNENSSI